MEIIKVQENYQDITEEWLIKAIPNSHKVKSSNYFETKNRIKYFVDNKNVALDYSKKEREVAEWSESNFGGEIYMLPRINYPEGIQTADYLFRGEYWDLKTITGCGKRIIEDTIKKKQKQFCNFILDVTESKLNNKELFCQLQKVYNSKATKFVDKLIIKRGNNIICIYKRQKRNDRNPTGHGHFNN